MKTTFYLFVALLGYTFSFAQGNFEIAMKERKAHTNVSQFEKKFLETDYVPTSYRLDINANPNISTFSGTTTMQFETTTETNQIKINAQPNLTITSVTFHDSPVTTYTRNDDVLTITLPETLSSSQSDAISIGFSGDADESYGYYAESHGSANVAYTLSEPFHASSWWVCKDDLLDKVEKVDIYITHPTELKAASNGKLMSTTDLGGGNTVTHWQHNYPIPAYLVAIGVSNYVEYNTTVEVGGVTMSILNYFYPESLPYAQENLDYTPTYITEISEKYGDYPYKLEKYGHMEWNWGGGMEHSTMSSMGGWSHGLIKHELAHQWFGDKVTCGTWSDIWVNEGFAEYTDGWLEDELNGEEAFSNWKAGYVDYITAEPGGSVYNPEPENQNRIFDYRLSYAKGSMAVHLIRYIINDDDVFFQAMQDLLDNPNHAYGYATTSDVKASLESSTGLNWDDFFEDWIYGEGHPIFNINVNASIENTNVTVTVNQSQSHSSVDFFETPFEIEFRGTGGQTTIRKFYLTENGQEFLVTDLPFEIIDYTFNPRYDVVCVVSSESLNNQEQEIAKQKVVLYPNPADNYFFIESEEKIDEVKVFELSGKSVYQQNNISLNKVQINSKTLSSGTYLVQVKANSLTRLLKLIVK